MRSILVHTCMYDVYKQHPSLNRISHYSFNILLGHAMLICPSTVDYWSNCHFFLLWADNRGVATKKPVCEHGKWVDITILLCFSYIKSDTTAISHATCKKNDLGNSMMNQSYTKNVTINCTKREGKKKFCLLGHLYFCSMHFFCLDCWKEVVLVVIKLVVMRSLTNWEAK